MSARTTTSALSVQDLRDLAPVPSCVLLKRHERYSLHRGGGPPPFELLERHAIERAVTAGLEELSERSLSVGDVTCVLPLGHAPFDIAVADLAGAVDTEGARR